ncbi:MAG: acyl-CoA dehydrogenase family protein [Dehalococcoidia bacterium]|jgi:alkylation response protein AidB-like acyl-CoA dehydrogenase|nr:acyl-CoA dehydrogenase family protein [Dehalococcoidia bacterium]
MDLKDSPSEAAFRAEVQEFVGAHWPPARSAKSEPTTNMKDAWDSWREALTEKGWIAPAWPAEYGGAGMSVKDQFVLNEVFAENSVMNIGGLGVMMLGPTLIAHGTEEQKKEHIPRMLAGEVQWAQGYSEPGSGSDLASLQTRAVRDGDEFVINGQKIWTTMGHTADWMFMLTRTDPDAPKHRGISYFLLDLKSPGVSIRPLTTMANNQFFSECFFEDVRVPASNALGEIDRGWYVGATTLDFERSGIGNAVGIQRSLNRLLSSAQDVPEEETTLDKHSTRMAFADRFIEANVAKMLSYRIISMQDHGQIPNYEASMSKLFVTELNQRIAALTLKAYGLYGTMWDTKRKEAQAGGAAGGYLNAVQATIAGGTSEIQRNIIATRGLGLPR